MERVASASSGQVEHFGSDWRGRALRQAGGLGGGRGSKFLIFGSSRLAVWEVKGGSGNHGKSNRTSRSGGFVEIWRFSGPWGAACGLQAGGSEGEGLISVWVSGRRQQGHAQGTWGGAGANPVGFRASRGRHGRLARAAGSTRGCGRQDLAYRRVSAELSALTHLTRRHRVGPGPTR